LALTPEQLTIAVTVLALYFPCVATFAVLLKELGLKDMLKAAMVMILTALVVGGMLKVVLIG
jgi:ferrous iron transport protein B